MKQVVAVFAPLLLAACAAGRAAPSESDSAPDTATADAAAGEPAPPASPVAESVPAATPVAATETAAPTPAPALPAAWIHPDSGMRFPDAAAGFLRGAPHRYSGHANWSCSYDLAGTPHIVTVYCYPADGWAASWGVEEASMPPDVREASRVVGSYLASRQMFHHVRAQTIEAGRGTPDGEVTAVELVRDGRRFHGWRGDHVTDFAKGAGGLPARSTLLLFPQVDGWSVKVRWTRPRDYGGEEEFAEFLRAFGISVVGR